MKYMVRFLFVFCAVAFIAASATGHVSAAAFNQNNIADDMVFDNINTMNASQIDVFLNSFSNSCISPNSGFKAIDPTGYSPINGYTYGGSVTAGQVIYDAAQAYGLNPQVLITTLEKEQSLVTGRNNYSGYCNNGDQHKYAAAVGYGCPDSVTTHSYSGLSLYQRNGVTVTSVGPTCVNTAIKAGFSQQIIRAAWLLKFGQQRSRGDINWAVIKGSWDNSDDPQTCYGGPMTQGTWQRCPSGATTYYDGYITIDSTAVHTDTGATAGLYWYTPHFHGNQIFFDLFTSWFGLPYANDTLSQHPNNTLISDGQHVYLVGSGTRQLITSGTVFSSYGYPWSVVKQASTGDNNLPLGTVIGDLAPGTVATASDGKVYLITVVSGVAQKQWLSYGAFTSLGYNWSQVMHVSQSELPSTTASGMFSSTQHPDGTLVSGGGKVYLIDQSNLRYVSALAFLTNLYRWDRVTPATTNDLALPAGTGLDIRQGAMLYSSGSIYVTDYDANGAFKRPVGPWECYANRLHYTLNDSYSVPTWALPVRTGSVFTC